jgi:HEAT repeat protein
VREEQKLAVIMARMLELLGRSAPDSDEPRAALHALVTLTDQRSATLCLDGDTLTVEGLTVPRELPFVTNLTSRMKAHRIGEMRIAHRAAPLDLLAALRALTLDPAQNGGLQEFQTAESSTVSMVGLEATKILRARRAVRVTKALGAIKGRIAAPVPPKPGASPSGFVSAEDGAAYKQLVELHKEAPTSVARAVVRLKGQDPDTISKGLSPIMASINKALQRNSTHEAIDAIITVVRQEDDEVREEARRRYAVALKRVLQPGALQALTPFLLDPLYAKDVGEIMCRAGRNATRLLLDLLVGAKTYAERRALIEVLRGVDSGLDIVVSMLNHHEWYVVRNAADLVGDLKIDEGVEALGKSCRHSDKRVRQSVGTALAKIGKPATVKYLSIVIRDRDPQVRAEVLKNIGGRGLAALAMLLVNAAETEQNETVLGELYRAMGRIGTPDSVRALIKATEPRGLIKGGLSPNMRMAAVEGLVLAGGAVAKERLNSLTRDRNKQVREAARQGLVDVQIVHGTADAALKSDDRFVVRKVAPRARRSGPVSNGTDRRTGRDRRIGDRRTRQWKPADAPFRDRRSGYDRRGSLERRKSWFR